MQNYKKRLFCGAWFTIMPTFYFILHHFGLIQIQYDNWPLDQIVIILAAVFICGAWLGVEITHLTKLSWRGVRKSIFIGVAIVFLSTFLFFITNLLITLVIQLFFTQPFPDGSQASKWKVLLDAAQITIGSFFIVFIGVITNLIGLCGASLSALLLYVCVIFKCRFLKIN